VLFVAELDLGQLQLALPLDEGLVRAVDHDVADGRVCEKLLERSEAEKLVDQHLLERELLAAVEIDLQLGQDLADDRAEFLGKLVLAESRRRFRIDALEKAGKHLLLDAMDRGFKTFGLAAHLGAISVLAVVQTVHGAHSGAGWILRATVEIGIKVRYGRELVGFIRIRRSGRRGAS